MALTPWRFMSSRSARIVSSSRVRSVRGCHSWRLTPRKTIFPPLTVMMSPSMATVRNPIFTVTVSVSVETVAS